MATNYPAGSDNFSAVAPNDLTSDTIGGRTHSAILNDMGDAVEAVQAELGANPSGSAATVVARLDGIESGERLGTGSVGTTQLADNAVTSAKIADGTIVRADVAAEQFADWRTVGNLLTANQASASATEGFQADACTGSIVGGRLRLTVTQSGYPAAWLGSTAGTRTALITAGRTYTARSLVFPGTLLAGRQPYLRLYLNCYGAGGVLLLATATPVVDGAAQCTAVAPAGAATIQVGVGVYEDHADNVGKYFEVDELGLWEGAGGQWAMPGVPITGLTASEPVVTAGLADGAVTSAKIADDTITADKIAADAVGTSEIAANAVTSAKIADGTIVNADISASAAIAGSKLALSTPVAANDPATKGYVDGLVGASGPFRSTGFAWYNGDAKTPDSYYALDAFGVDAGALSGNTGYGRQTTGVPVDPQVQSRMRRCVLKDDGTAVRYYLDCDNSAKIAGTYSGGVQTGWVRVHEGFTDPVRPIPGQATTGCAALRADIPNWSASATYSRGDRVLHDGKLWDSLASGNINITPAAGTTDAALDGTDGQVMVEIPRFYWRTTSDPSTGRTTFSVACNPAEMLPFPNLAVASTAPTSITWGRAHAVHPAFAKAGVQRPARYIAAYRATASDAGNNGTGTLKSVCDGTATYAGTISRTNFRAKARNRNSGLTDPSGAANDVWGLVDYHLWHAVQVLFLTEFRTFYAGSVLGGGNNAGSDYQRICGRSNGIGNASGNYVSGALVTPTTSDTDGVAYRGIEDLYGSQWLWIDGWNAQYTVPGVEMYVSDTPAQFADGTASNYALAGVAPHSAGSWAYAKTLLPGTLIASKVGGSTTEYTTDGFYSANSTSGWYAALVGGDANAGAYGGVLALRVDYGAAGSGAGVGAALAR